MNLTVEDLKVIRLALSSYPLSTQVMKTLDNVDAELAKHNLRATYRRLPKRKYQHNSTRGGEYVFEPIRSTDQSINRSTN